MRNCFQRLARARLLSRRTNIFCATATITGTAATNHAHRQPLLSLSRPSQHITATTNPRCTKHRGRTAHSHRQYLLSLSRPSQHITATTNPRCTKHRGRTAHSHRQYLLSLSRPSQQITDTTNPGDTSHAEEPTTSTVSTFSSLRELRNRFQQARTHPTTNSTDTWRFFPGRNSPG
jgi:hypothetical protein